MRWVDFVPDTSIYAAVRVRLSFLSACPGALQDNVESRRGKTTLNRTQRLRDAARGADVDAAIARDAGRDPARTTTEVARTMARKPATRVEFTLFDVIYEDGSQRSNRRVPSDVLGGLDGDDAARAVIEEQDRIIAEKSGTPAIAVKSIHRSGGK